MPRERCGSSRCISGTWTPTSSDCKVGLTSNLTTIEQEMLMKALKQGYRVSEIPSHEYERRWGTSKVVVWKLWFAYLSKALVVFPGGFGTLDEMFEVLTLAQTHKLAKKITVVVYGSEYWKKVFNLQALVDTGAISPKDLELFHYADTPEEAFETLRQGLTENHLTAEASGKLRGHPTPEPDLMAGVTMEDFLGPELAKTRK